MIYPYGYAHPVVPVTPMSLWLLLSSMERVTIIHLIVKLIVLHAIHRIRAAIRPIMQ